MITNKYNAMIERIEGDFSLASNGFTDFSELIEQLQNPESILNKDIILLEELSNLLKNGQAQIHLQNESKKKLPNVLLRTDEEDDWEHIVISQNGVLLSDNIESKRLRAKDILQEFERVNIISLQEEKIR